MIWNHQHVWWNVIKGHVWSPRCCYLRHYVAWAIFLPRWNTKEAHSSACLMTMVRMPGAVCNWTAFCNSAVSPKLNSLLPSTALPVISEYRRYFTFIFHVHTKLWAISISAFGLLAMWRVYIEFLLRANFLFLWNHGHCHNTMLCVFLVSYITATSRTHIHGHIATTRIFNWLFNRRDGTSKIILPRRGK